MERKGTSAPSGDGRSGARESGRLGWFCGTCVSGPHGAGACPCASKSAGGVWPGLARGAGGCRLREGAARI